jgi:iron(III) transport system substrate-binding protein
MNEFLSYLSRRKFIVTAGASAIGAIVLNSCTSGDGQEQTDAPAATESPIAASDETALYEAAKKEGKFVLYTPFFTQEIVNEIGKAFTTKYPGISFEGTRQTASTLFQKLTQEIQSGLKVTDFYSATDISQIEQLKQQGKLLQYEPLGKEKLLEAYRNFDPENFYQTGALIPIIIAYNTQKLAAADLPKSWKDLLQDKYKDKMATGSGAASGQVGTWALAMQQKYGWNEYIGKFHKLNPKLGRSINEVIPVLVSGEREIGIATLGQTLTRKAQGDPIDVIYPSDGTVVAVGCVCILKDAPHPNAAKLFMNFLMSKEYSELVTKYYEQPLRGDVKPSGVKEVSDIQTIAPASAEIQKEIPEIITKWRDSFGA